MLSSHLKVPPSFIYPFHYFLLVSFLISESFPYTLIFLSSFHPNMCTKHNIRCLILNWNKQRSMNLTTHRPDWTLTLRDFVT